MKLSDTLYYEAYDAIAEKLKESMYKKDDPTFMDTAGRAIPFWRDLGLRLYAEGGDEALLEVMTHVSDFVGSLIRCGQPGGRKNAIDLKELSCCWRGIGDWRD